MSAQDNLLIAEFNAHSSDDAFAALVKQHINLVFATALRQVGDSGAAEEIAQNVFVVLAQSCGKLGSHPTIAGWLYHTTLNKSREWLRSELRRHHREQVAVDLALAGAEGDSVWSPLVPLLDEALLKLSEPDRLAVIMHYMEGRAFHEVGSVLGISEDGARKRVSRCLDELSRFFVRRGFPVPTAASVAPLFALSSHAAPAGLAASATSAALVAAHSTASLSTLTLIKGALKIMAWSKSKTAILAAAGLLLAAGTTTLIVFRHQIEHSLTLAGGRRAIAHHIATPLDLTAFYQMHASDFDNNTGWPAWQTVPRGFQVFANVPLKIDGIFSLWGEGNANIKMIFPEQIDIPVNRKFQTLYVCHCAFFKAPNGTPVCQVVFRYEDGTSLTNQLLYGDDILSWTPSQHGWVPRPTSANSKRAWLGGAFSPKNKEPLCFCLTALDNPQPALEVTSIDLYSCKSKSAACILAMTTGQSGLMK